MLKRSHLFQMAEQRGFSPDKPLPPGFRVSMEAKLRAYFRTPEGKEVLARAPRVWWEDAGKQGMRPMTEDEAVEALLSEIEKRAKRGGKADGS